MSKKFLLAACSLIALPAFSQTCQNFLFLQKNKTIEMTVYNKKGEPNGREVYQVSDVSSSGGTTTGTLASEMFDKKDKSIAKANSSIQCKGGEIFVDMKMMLSPQQAQQSASASATVQAAYLDYPADMHVGDALKDGNLSMDLSARAPGGPPAPPGPPQTLNMVISNRKVDAQESVTTAAGTWNCFKISFKSKVTVKTGPFGFPINLEGTEWYAPGFGIVKTESKYGRTEITSIK